VNLNEPHKLGLISHTRNLLNPRLNPRLGLTQHPTNSMLNDETKKYILILKKFKVKKNKNQIL